MKTPSSIATQSLLALLITVISVLALSRIVELNVLALKLVLIAVVLAGVLLVAFQVLHMRVEEAVKTNEALLRLFIRHTPAAIAMFDNDMRYLQVSDRFLTEYHLEGQDIIAARTMKCFLIFRSVGGKFTAAYSREQSSVVMKIRTLHRTELMDGCSGKVSPGAKAMARSAASCCSLK